MTAHVDLLVTEFFVNHRSPALVSAARALSYLGASVFLIPLVLASGGLLLVLQKSRRPLLLLLGSYVGAVVLSNLAKVVVARARPPLHLAMGVHYLGYSFPSGHATQSLAVYGMLAAVLSGLMRSPVSKTAAWIVSVGVCALVGLSRLELGAHWLTDVAGGYAIGGAWSLMLFRRFGMNAHG